MELPEARSRAAAYLEQVEPADGPLQLAPGDEHVIDIGWAWAFAWSTVSWFEAGQGRPPAGGGPIVVVKVAGHTWMLGSATSYDEQLATYAAQHELEHTVLLEEAGRQEATILAEWLTERSPSRPTPLTAADLVDWRWRVTQGWTLYEMPGFSNTMFLVRDRVVYEFQPSRMSVDEALAAAGASG